MVRIFLSIITILCIGSGIISLKARSAASASAGQLQELNTQLTAKTSELSKKDEEIKELKGQVEASSSAKESVAAEVAAAKTEAEKAQGEVAAIKTSLSEKDDEITKLRNELAEKSKTVVEAPAADPELENKLKELQTKLDEQVQITQTLEKSAKDAESRANSLAAEDARRKAALSAPNLEGTVLAVEPSWNFVILNVGDRQGVALNSTLIVKRGHAMIGKVRVTSLDPSRAVADIIPGTLARGAFVQPGDTVIFGGK